MGIKGRKRVGFDRRGFSKKSQRVFHVACDCDQGSWLNSPKNFQVPNMEVYQEAENLQRC